MGRDMRSGILIVSGVYHGYMRSGIPLGTPADIPFRVRSPLGNRPYENFATVIVQFQSQLPIIIKGDQYAG